MSHILVGRPDAAEYAEHYSGYIGNVPEEDLLSALGSQLESSLSLLRTIPEERATSRYAPDKWTIKQLLGHVMDCERVFGFRAFWFARNSPIALSSFDQDSFMGNVNYDKHPWTSLLRQYEHLRIATLDLFEIFDEVVWTRLGIVNNREVSIRALGYMILGHERHHLEILKSRYLQR
jgi:hypothetical protein